MKSAQPQLRASLCIILATALGGCGMSGDNADDQAALRGIDGVPVISGAPQKTATVSSGYSFVPVADDSDGDVLDFSIANRPPWVVFDTATGTLQGTPAPADVGTHENIVISVSDGNSVISLPSFAIRVSMTETAEEESASEPSQPPVVSGSPNPMAIVDNVYAFQPDAIDPDGDPLSFSIVNKPVWATFDTTSGRLEGRPGNIDVGLSDRILLSATDGPNVSDLNQFDISVEAVGPLSLTISWAAPTDNVDGSALTNLTGYRVYYGTTSGAYSEVVELNSTGLSSYTIENLSPGNYYLVMTSINSFDLESEFTPEISIGLGS